MLIDKALEWLGWFFRRSGLECLTFGHGLPEDSKTTRSKKTGLVCHFKCRDCGRWWHR